MPIIDDVAPIHPCWPPSLTPVMVTASPASARVSQGEVMNAADRALLRLASEELIGAKQNRVLNTSVLVAAGARVFIPVSCVEQGRWAYRRPGCASSNHLRRAPVAATTLTGPAPAPVAPARPSDSARYCSAKPLATTPSVALPWLPREWRDDPGFGNFLKWLDRRAGRGRFLPPTAPPTVGLEDIDEACVGAHVVGQAKRHPMRRVLVNCWGFCDTHSWALLERLDAE